MRISKLGVAFFLFPIICISQTLTGRVIDKITQQPIETASVYFNNTTIGTTTNANGEFSIDYSDAVQSTLVISYLGFEKVLISDYRSQNNINVELVEADNTLDEVHIAYDDGLTRRQKLRLFRKEFLGTSKFGKSCKILNEDDLVLKYDKHNKALYASSKVPLQILNKALEYEITYDLMEFETNFGYANLSEMRFSVNSVTFYGTSFYNDLYTTKKKTLKHRDKAYKGSVQHFLRSLYNKNLRTEGYWIYHDKFRIEEWEYFLVEALENEDFKKVTLKENVSILFEKNDQSKIHLEVPEFYVDSYGNFTPVVGVYFSGVMGNQRIGDTLPLAFGLTGKE
ncbi:carboxypeptidase-like regulatory domain-containing protein [Winogradskyella sp. F6397]|uniref:Carboxypeptidase-like regulatory domain-containing protein n=1 Tax=Winogradskyella marina TaxID=2785530 RepID=A0ABS0EL87_9FLAO|nr:carboxypeptidase-like regulatory domain-containing protein [Winogradskyella marina]MBF8151229.1 carboxypeptidase-like regulatory domain-containing protein [Winogradskyella marina]